MTLALHTLALETFRGMLGSLDHWLDLAAEHARERGFAADELVAAQLAPDMYTLAQQVQLACFHAQDAVARLTGAAPASPEPAAGRTLAQLKAQIASTRAGLAQRSTGAFAAAAERQIVIPVDPQRQFVMTGAELLRDWSLPHFYFHVVTAYGILRQRGVALGKAEYLCHAARYMHERANHAGSP